ncbi:hypothetical protein [Arthrobacter sp. 2MCAF14]|uniref:hypothetical protein n=1 Tax=Arthrobacter sp. 2MCAF14 TaxID=3232982 RepID=UPI003F90FB4D
MSLATDPERMHLAGTKLAQRDLLDRWKVLDDEIKQLNAEIIRCLNRYIAREIYANLPQTTA